MDDEALVVADCDTGIDDAIGLMYLTAQPRVRLLAVGGVHGSTTAEQAAVNTLSILEHVERSDVPVAAGAAAPLGTPVPTEDSETSGHARDGLGGTAESPAGQVSSQSAADQLVQLARARPGELTVLATGPLTNVALATAAEPRLPQLLHRLVWSGGARTAGGEGAEPVEANAGRDPEAAERVLAAGYALTLVPQRAARYVPVETGWLEYVAADRGKRAQRAADLLEPYMRAFVLAGHGQAWLPDTVAAALAANPSLGAGRTERVQIQLHGEHRGQLLSEHHPEAGPVATARAPVQVVTCVSADTLRERLSATLRERHASELSDPRDTGSTPNIARVNDYLLGGAANTPADRTAGEQMLQVFPRNVDWARHNRAFLGWEPDTPERGRGAHNRRAPCSISQGLRTRAAATKIRPTSGSRRRRQVRTARTSPTNRPCTPERVPGRKVRACRIGVSILGSPRSGCYAVCRDQPEQSTETTGCWHPRRTRAHDGYHRPRPSPTTGNATPPAAQQTPTCFSDRPTNPTPPAPSANPTRKRSASSAPSAQPAYGTP